MRSKSLGICNGLEPGRFSLSLFCSLLLRLLEFGTRLCSGERQGLVLCGLCSSILLSLRGRGSSCHFFAVRRTHRAHRLIAVHVAPLRKLACNEHCLRGGVHDNIESSLVLEHWQWRAGMASPGQSLTHSQIPGSRKTQSRRYGSQAAGCDCTNAIALRRVHSYFARTKQDEDATYAGGTPNAMD